jgi:hypothetical protein
MRKHAESGQAQTLAAIKMTLGLVPGEAWQMKFADLLRPSFRKSPLPSGAAYLEPGSFPNVSQPDHVCRAIRSPKNLSCGNVCRTNLATLFRCKSGIRDTLPLPAP